MKTLLWSLCIGLVTLANGADTRARGAPLPPHVEFRPVHASRLRLGMEATEVVRIMGEVPQGDSLPHADVQVLNFPAEPIPTKVVLTGRKVSGISLDIARLDDLHLPLFTRAALRGMSSQGVRDMLGVPTDARHYEYFGIKLDQLIFERGHYPAVSIFFVEDRVVAKTLGSVIPADIFRVILPAPPEISARSAAEDGAVVGASASDLKALFGAAKLLVDYRFNGQPAAHVLYQTRDHHTLSVYVLGGVITEITDVGTWSIDDTPSG